MIPAVSGVGSKLGLPYQWVIVGASGNLYTSTDTNVASWTSRTSSFSTTAINTVASNGSTIYVAAGASGKLATSPDGITWTQRTSGFGTTAINHVAFGNGVWVAVGASGTMTTATDPTGTWTSRTSSFGTTNIRRVAYGNGYWVAVGESGKVATATDPTGTWTQRTVSLGTGPLSGVAYSPATGLFTIGVGASAGFVAYATASNPTSTWTARTTLSTTETKDNCQIVATPTVTAAVGYTPTFSTYANYSTDGSTFNISTFTSSLNYWDLAADDSAPNQLFTAANNAGTLTKQLGTTGNTYSGSTNASIGFQVIGICHSSGVYAIR